MGVKVISGAIYSLNSCLSHLSSGTPCASSHCLNMRDSSSLRAPMEAVPVVGSESRRSTLDAIEKGMEIRHLIGRSRAGFLPLLAIIVFLSEKGSKNPVDGVSPFPINQEGEDAYDVEHQEEGKPFVGGHRQVVEQYLPLVQQVMHVIVRPSMVSVEVVHSAEDTASGRKRKRKRRVFIVVPLKVDCLKLSRRAFSSLP